MKTAIHVALLLFSLGTSTRALADETVLREGAPREPVSDGGLYLGGGGGFSPDTQNAPITNASLVLDRPLFWRMGLWASGETSVIWKEPQADLALRLCVGIRTDLYRSDARRVRILGTVSFAHQHEATVSAWRDSPFSNLFGESKDGLGHRSGVGVGAGLLVTPWIDTPDFRSRLRLLVRLDGVWLPDDKGPRFFLGLMTSVGVAL